MGPNMPTEVLAWSTGFDEVPSLTHEPVPRLQFTGFSLYLFLIEPANADVILLDYLQIISK